MFEDIKSQIEIVVDKELKDHILEWEEQGIFYGVFPISGDSMTTRNKQKSIPHKSKVLAYELQLDVAKDLSYHWPQIPMGEPLLIMGNTAQGKPFFLCKTITFLDAVYGNIRLTSYNKQYKDQWIPFSWVTHIYRVVKII